MSTSRKTNTLKKPRIGDALAFAEGGKPTSKDAARSGTAPAGLKSGLVPAGDTRLTANIRSDLHIKLKVRAAQESTTVGELIEQWIEGWG